jgi:hypothetical protein
MSSLPHIPADATVQTFQHGRLGRWLNRLCGTLDLVNGGMIDPDVDRVIKRARSITKLHDYGDERVLEPLGRALAGITKRDYAAIGRVFLIGMATRAMIHRLKIEKWFKDNPSALDIPVKRPIFVLGFPRTGTTLLQNLLSQTPGRRHLQFWELTSPIPVHPDPARDKAKRISNVNRDLYWAYKLVPEMPAIHDIGPESAEECWSLFANTMAVLNLDIAHGVKDYGDWLLTYDMEWPYREYRRLLQMLLHREGAEHLVLKCPEHLWFLDSLLKVFPDAAIVWTHRDPIDAVASYSSFISIDRRTMMGKVDPLSIGPHIADRFLKGVNRGMAVRDGLAEDRIFDVEFYELVQDPAAMVHRIEDHFDLPRTDGALLQGFLDSKRRDGRGQHRYTPEMFGLDVSETRASFQSYIERFGVVMDPPA